MAARELPARPSLEQYKKQAKELLKKLRSADPDALEHARQYQPRLSKLPASGLATAKIALADAQFVIAREHAFDSWKKFAKHLEAAAGEPSPATVWNLAESAVLTGDATMLERLLCDHEPVLRKDPRSSWLGDLTLDGHREPLRAASRYEMSLGTLVRSSKPGLVTVAGKPGDDLAPGTLNSVLTHAGLKP